MLSDKESRPVKTEATNSQESFRETEYLSSTIQNEAKNSRLDHWKERYAKDRPNLTYKTKPVNQQENSHVAIYAEHDDKNATSLQRWEDQRSNLCAATGSSSAHFGSLMLSQSIAGFFKNNMHDETFVANAVHEALVAMNPKDEYEGMLTSRLIVLHNQYMNFMERVTNREQSGIVIDLNINRATKLMRVYNETLEALSRYRRKGEQKVVVQHVNVSGGQTLVAGQVNTGGGESNKK